MIYENNIFEREYFIVYLVKKQETIEIKILHDIQQLVRSIISGNDAIYNHQLDDDMEKFLKKENKSQFNLKKYLYFIKKKIHILWNEFFKISNLTKAD